MTGEEKKEKDQIVRKIIILEHTIRKEISTMAKNLDTVILWEDAVTMFKETELPYIRETERRGHIDEVMRREAWNNFTDYLCKDELISDWQYENWEHPECCERDC